MRMLHFLIAGFVFGVALAQAAPIPLYEWNFDGATGVPTVSAGGGTLSLKNSTNGLSTFNGVGVTGNAFDQAYDGYNGVNQYNTANPAGIAETGSANVAVGMGTLSQLTVTFWMKANSAWPMPSQNGSTINARLVMAGPTVGYDQGAGGFELTLNSSDKLQKGGNGNNPISANAFSTFLPANGMSTSDWVFVAFAYDSDASVFFDAAIRAATGNAVSNNAYVYVGSKAAAPVLFDSNGVLAAGNVSPGPVALGSSAFVLLGNRDSLSRDFTGMIDDVRVYNSVLSVSDLDAVRQAALTPEPASLGLVGLGLLMAARRSRRA